MEWLLDLPSCCPFCCASWLFPVIWYPSVPPPCSQCPPAQPSCSFFKLPPVYDHFLRWDPKLHNPFHPWSCCSIGQRPQMSDKNTAKIDWGFQLVQPPRDLFLSINTLASPGCLCPSINFQCPPGSHSEGSLFCEYRLFPLPPTFTRECNCSDWHYTRLSQLLSFPNCYTSFSSYHHRLLLPKILQLENSDNL